jgi:NAD(P)-dependent dehydrogenase (short-subunit alcohol dehydrogenase family)
MNSSPETSSRWLVITGASRGIGLATTRKFLEEGFKVINISRSDSPLAEVIQLNADLADARWPETVSDALAVTLLRAERLVLVHNAAIQCEGGVQDLQAQDLRRVLELNVVAPVILNGLLGRHMNPGSAIVYVGSTMSLRATAGMAAYVASKHALLGLMRSTCQDLAGTGVHTACVCPGFTDTEMLREYGGEALEQLARLSTQARLVKPGEVADSIYFCATNAVVNGSVVRADLGFIEH